MRYTLRQIHCRPWKLNGLSLKLMESHYENNYGGALRRLNAVTEQLESLDMYENAYHMDFGANARAYVETFLRNVEWQGVEDRYQRAVEMPALQPIAQPEYAELPSIGVEEVKERLSSGEPLQVIDVRPRRSLSRQQDIAEGVLWRDPELIEDWIGQLSKSDPVVVYCAYGFHVGCNTARRLREAGFDAKYMDSGHSGWKAIGAPMKLAT
jgi:Fe-Mn family superoxide dismutase